MEYIKRTIRVIFIFKGKRRKNYFFLVKIYELNINTNKKCILWKKKYFFLFYSLFLSHCPKTAFILDIFYYIEKYIPKNNYKKTR